MGVPSTQLYYWDGASYTSFNAPIQTMTISRGRSRQLNRYESGSMTVTFYNADRKLDPLNTASAYKSLVVPRVRFQVKADSTVVYTGVVKDWDLDYDIAGRDTAVAYCSDAMTVLANYVFTEEASFSQGTAGTRFSDVLTYFGYSGPTLLDAGNTTLVDDIVDMNTQCVDYLFRVASSDGGNFFVDASGNVSYVSRYGRLPTAEVEFADDGTGVGYSALTNQYGDELLYNQVFVQTPVGSSTVTNTTSVSTFGLSVLVLDDLLNFYQSGIDDLSSYFLSLYGDPQVRFTGLQVQLAGLSSADKAKVLGLDLADPVTVKRSFSTGSPLSVTQSLMVTGIRHQIEPGSHIVEFTFEPSPYKSVFILDSATSGILNTDKLG